MATTVLQATTSAGAACAWPCSTSASAHTAGSPCRHPAVSVDWNTAAHMDFAGNHMQGQQCVWGCAVHSLLEPSTSQDSSRAYTYSSPARTHVLLQLVHTSITHHFVCNADAANVEPPTVYLLCTCSMLACCSWWHHRVAAQDQHCIVEHHPAPVPPARSRGPTTHSPRADPASRRSASTGTQGPGSCRTQQAPDSCAGRQGSCAG